MAVWIEDLLPVSKLVAVERRRGREGSTTREDNGVAGGDDGYGVVLESQSDIYAAAGQGLARRNINLAPGLRLP